MSSQSMVFYIDAFPGLLTGARCNDTPRPVKTFYAYRLPCRECNFTDMQALG
jgi:hypothetical protein